MLKIKIVKSLIIIGVVTQMLMACGGSSNNSNPVSPDSNTPNTIELEEPSNNNNSTIITDLETMIDSVITDVSATTMTPDVSTQATDNTFPIVGQGIIRGVNLQGALRSSIHPQGATEQEIIERVANVITLLGFNSVRIGGTSSFGGTYDETYKGFGWSKFSDDLLVNTIHPNDPYLNESYNFNVMAIQVAAQAGVSVWIDLSTKSDSTEIDLILSLLDEYGVPLAGVTRDNEPYLPERFESHQSAYSTLNDDIYRDAWWPAMYVINGDQPDTRKIREQAIALDVNEYREAPQGIELHVYYPHEADDANISPVDWISNALDNSAEVFGTSNFMVGEWSGKGQETFSDDEINKIIESYLTVFEEREIPYYYQLLGSGNDKFGLWNFKWNDGEGKLNRGAQVFIQHHCGGSCI